MTDTVTIPRDLLTSIKVAFNRIPNTRTPGIPYEDTYAIARHLGRLTDTAPPAPNQAEAIIVRLAEALTLADAAAHAIRALLVDLPMIEPNEASAADALRILEAARDFANTVGTE